MAIIKCKMCGGDLNLVEGASTAECEFCGSVQTIPNLDDEKKLIQFERAERLRKQCEFDKAAGIYETIVADFRQEAEAYWGLVLCKYGIEYVDDPATGKKIPTCHRSSFDSIMEDSDFEQALENADGMARRVYREEAKQIEEIRKGIIAVSANEEPYDIFICYKETSETGDRTLDSVLAQDVYDALTDRGYRVFFSRISLEDKLGMEYEPYIFAALNSAKIMLAFGTDYEYFNAVWVKNEWSRFLKLMAKDKEKHLIPCFKGIDAYDMPKEFARLQAQDLGKVGAVQDLLRGIDKLLPRQQETAVAVQNATANTSNLVMRGQFALDDGDWKKAGEYFERALDENPQNSKAYVGKVLVRLRLSSVEQINDNFVKLEGDKDFNRAIRFATGAEKTQLENIKENADRKWLVKCFTAGLKKVVRQKESQEVLEEIKANIALATVEGYQKAAALCGDARGRHLGPVFTLELVRTYERQAEILRFLSSNNEEYTIEQIQNSECVGAFLEASLYVEYLQKMIDDGCVEKGVAPNTYCVTGTTEIRRETKANTAAANKARLEPLRKKYVGAAKLIAAGVNYTVGLRSDGTVVAVGDNQHGQCDVSEWKDIVAIAAGKNHTVGLMADGTAAAVGDNQHGQCDVSEWMDIVAIAAGTYHTVGLRSDGTVVTVGNKHDQCDVSGWTDIVAIAAGTWHTVGLRSDGTVVTVGDNQYGECDVSAWTDIVAIAASANHTVGLRSDGTVVAVGNNQHGKCDVSGWTDIVAIAADLYETSGVRLDGTVVIAGLLRTPVWNDIIGIATGDWHTVGLRSDGTVVAEGSTLCGACNVSGWKLFNKFENLDKERENARIARAKREEEERIARQKAEEERILRQKKEEKQRIAAQYRAAGLCQHCGGELKGFFSKKCVSCGKPKDY